MKKVIPCEVLNKHCSRKFIDSFCFKVSYPKIQSGCLTILQVIFSRCPRSSKKERTVDAYSQKEEIRKPIKPFERNVKKGWGKKNTTKIHYTETVFDFTDVDDNIRLCQESVKCNRFENNFDTPWTQQKERKNKIKKEYRKKGRRTKKDVNEDLSQDDEKINSDHDVKYNLVSAKEEKIENNAKTQSFYGTKIKKEIKTGNPKKEVKERLKLDTRHKDKKKNQTSQKFKAEETSKESEMEENHSTPDSVENKSFSKNIKEETVKVLQIMPKKSREVQTKRNSKLMSPKMDSDLNDKNYVSFIKNYNLCEDEIGVNDENVTITKNEKKKVTHKIKEDRGSVQENNGNKKPQENCKIASEEYTENDNLLLDECETSLKELQGDAERKKSKRKDSRNKNFKKSFADESISSSHISSLESSQEPVKFLDDTPMDWKSKKTKKWARDLNEKFESIEAASNKYQVFSVLINQVKSLVIQGAVA